MTDANTLTPTDAGILSLAYDCSALPECVTDATLLVFAHAVIAKWGTQGTLAAAAAGMQPVARIRYERNTPGRENEMPRVLSCNRMADGVYEVFTASQVQAALAAAPSGPVRVPLTAAQMAAGREAIFSTANPYCPCDSKTFRKVAEWVERHHGITAAPKGGQHAE